MNVGAAYALGVATPILLSLAVLAAIVLDDAYRARRRRHRGERR